MALIDRFAHDGEVDEGVETISAHEFAAGLWLLRNGDITVPQLKLSFNIVGSESTQLDELITFYQALSKVDKDKFVEKTEVLLIALQGKYITKSKFKSLMGMV